MSTCVGLGRGVWEILVVLEEYLYFKALLAASVSSSLQLRSYYFILQEEGCRILRCGIWIKWPTYGYAFVAPPFKIEHWTNEFEYY